MRVTVGFFAATLGRLLAQPAMSLSEAVQTGLQHHPAIHATDASHQAARSRIDQARAGFLPKVGYVESYQRSNNPVFVFSSLLTQHQFTAQNFELRLLNRPNALNNFQSQLRADQTLFDAGNTRAQLRSAELGTNIAGEDERRARMDVVAGIAAAYFGAVLAKQRLAVANDAVRAAESDLTRAENVRSAGMSTDADVLSVRVHLAAMREREIEARYTLEVASAALNDALGLPLETPHQLSTPLTGAKLQDTDVETLTKVSINERPDARQAALGVRVAETQSSAARSALFPRVSIHGAFETDRQTFATRGGANWLFEASLEWNLFNGFADKARQRETAQLAQAAKAQQRRTESNVQLEVRRAYASFRGAAERIEVAAAAVAQSEETLRITRNRYEAGLTTITELLRNESAWLDTKTSHLEAVYDQRVAAAGLELAAGTLSGDSDALK